MKKRIILIFIIILILFTNIYYIYANSDEPNLVSEAAILVDSKTNQILYTKNENKKMFPASTTKILTAILALENCDLSETVTISENVINSIPAGYSSANLQYGEILTVEQLLQLLLICSANDAANALAEYVGGSIESFVSMMNSKIYELGLENTHFVNPHGLDAENHYSSAYDMAIMALNLIKYEDVLKYTSTYEDYFNKPDGSRTWLVNTNKLVRFYNGVDGLKTGYTKNAGYCLTATAKKDNLRYITVLMGSPTLNDRSKETTEMLNYAFNSFKLNTIIDENTSLGQVKVEKGTEDYVDVVVKKTVAELIEINSKVDEYTYNLKIDKITAPVKKGDIVGKIEIMDNEGLIVKEENVTVAKDINKATYLQTLLKNFKTIITGKELNINKI